jgi:2,3-bisphosphoglycerate-dependent phosphoglycerate mutase
MTKRFVFCCLLLSVLVATATAQSTIFIVRHGEKTDSSNDSDLSEAGRARAEALAKMLKDKNITAIYATEFKRTQQTAAPLAKTLGVTVTTLPAKDNAALIAKLRSLNGNALVVGHGNTIPDLIKALGISEPMNIGENDYDNLFEIVLEEKPKLIRLHYH